MAALNDWVCLAHGEFENRTGECPHGCSKGMVQVMFKKAPAAHTSGKKQFIDRKTADLARQFGDTEMNDRFDRSRIDMTQTDDIQKKRMMGQTYSVPLDPKTGVAGYLGSTAAPDVSVSDAASQSAKEGLRATTIVHDDKGTTKLPEAA
jgi:hypothetical protein